MAGWVGERGSKWVGKLPLPRFCVALFLYLFFFLIISSVFGFFHVFLCFSVSVSVFVSSLVRFSFLFVTPILGLLLLFCLFVYLSFCLLVSLFVCLLACLSVCQSVCPSVCVSTCLSGVAKNRVIMWEVLEGFWNGQAAADLYNGPLKKALKRTFPGQKTFILVEDGDKKG